MKKNMKQNQLQNISVRPNQVVELLELISIQDILKEDKKVEDKVDYKEEMIIEIKKIHKDQEKK